MARERAYRDRDHLDEMLRARPGSGPEPTDQESYWDSETRPGWASAGEDVPWLDQAPHREGEL